MSRLLRGIARTAVVAGTATVASRVSRRQAGRWSREAAPEPNGENEPGQNQPGENQPGENEPGDDMSARIDQLRELGELRAQGVLSDAEFEQQKARILGS